MVSKTCPSAACVPGATLIGVLGRDGRIKHLRTPMKIDADFVDQAKGNSPPDARMRFAGPCAEGRCLQWTGSACGVVEKVLARIGEHDTDLRAAAPPPCTIRAICRWHVQRGIEACLVCDLVVRTQEALAAE